MAESKLKMTMKVTARGGASATVTVRLDIEKAEDAAEAMKLLVDPTLKSRVFAGRYEHQLGDYGMQNGASPRPVFKDEKDRSSLIAYERDFKFTRTL